MSGYEEIKKLREAKKKKESNKYQKRLSEFIKKRKRKPAATMRELRIKRAKAAGLKPSDIGIKEK